MKVRCTTVRENDHFSMKATFEDLLGYAYILDTGCADSHGGYTFVVGCDEPLSEEDIEYLFENNPENCNWDSPDDNYPKFNDADVKGY